MSIDLKRMVQGYGDCIAWVSEGDEDLQDTDGWSAEMIARMTTDCAAFLGKLAETDLPDILAGIDFSDEQLGHDFWLTRNGHGAGFWDRKELDFRPETEAKNVGEWLTEIAHSFGELDVYAGDDNMEYFA